MDPVKEKNVSIEERGKERRLKSLINDLETEKVDGLNDLIGEMKNLKKNNTYMEMCQAVDLGTGIFVPNTPVDEIRANSPLINQARNILSDPPFHFPPITDLICFKTFYVSYTFLESIYYMNLGKKLDYEDYKDLYSSGLDQKVIFELDKFNKSSSLPKLKPDFFIKLKKIKWHDKKTKQFYRKLNKLKTNLRYDILGISYTFSHTRFSTTENAFLLFLAGCNVVNDDRDKITPKDIIIAYKTYFKLIKTDITKYITLSKPSSENGYLICDKCNEYYKLQPGESPDDFTDECECGGKLRFVYDIEDI